MKKRQKKNRLALALGLILFLAVVIGLFFIINKNVTGNAINLQASANPSITGNAITLDDVGEFFKNLIGISDGDEIGEGGVLMAPGDCGNLICEAGEDETTCPSDCLIGNGDSIYHLEGTNGYSMLNDSNVTDLDYSKDFTVEAIVDLKPFLTGARWGNFLAKGDSSIGYNIAKGFSLGIYTGDISVFGPLLHANIGDGTKQIQVTNSAVGQTYAVMVWTVADKRLTLYVNGQQGQSATNTAMNNLNIDNNQPLHMGWGGASTSIQRDILMARLWNRQLTASEINSLWKNYNSSGKTKLDNGFNQNNLVSEWLMQDIIKIGNNTYLNDSKNKNHLLLFGKGIIYSANGNLSVVYPTSDTNIDTAVTLKVRGGLSEIPNPVKPLSYYFEIDEVNTFDSPALKTGLSREYGEFKPILKPSTTYYWRAKVIDASGQQSSYTQIRSFTTKSPQDWYVRNGVIIGYTTGSYKPIPKPGVYGNQDGSSYENAFNGLRDIKFGEGGVEAGDTLHVCGEHVFNLTTGGSISYSAVESFYESGYSPEYPITITMDCKDNLGSDDKGIVYGFFYPGSEAVVWNGPDSNGVYWTDDLSRGAQVEFNGNDYIFLDLENQSSWIGHNGSVYKTLRSGQAWLTNYTYVKTSDGSNPNGKIYSPGGGYGFDITRGSYLKFVNCTFLGSRISAIPLVAQTNAFLPIPASHHITFDNVEMAYGSNLAAAAGNNYWIVRNSNFHHMSNGFYLSGSDVYNTLFENNKIHDICSLCMYDTYCYYNSGSDCHGIGIQSGANHIIQNNTIWDTGAAIDMWSNYGQMKNITVRYNLIRDIWAATTGGYGIAVEGGTDPALRTGIKIYGNIIMNTGLGKYLESWQGDGIHTGRAQDIEIYNNVVYNARLNGITDVSNPPYGASGKIYNNIIVNAGFSSMAVGGNATAPWNVFLDNNLYYSNTSNSTNMNNYVSITSGKTLVHDTNSIIADPKFVDAENGNFKLQEGSPAINAGFDLDGA